MIAWYSTPEGRRWLAELLIRWLADEERWATPAYIRSWRAWQDNRTRKFGKKPRRGTVRPLPGFEKEIVR